MFIYLEQTYRGSFDYSFLGFPTSNNPENWEYQRSNDGHTVSVVPLYSQHGPVT
jgi:hypothetical protein